CGPSGSFLSLTGNAPLANFPPLFRTASFQMFFSARKPGACRAAGNGVTGTIFFRGRGLLMGNKSFFGLVGTALTGLALLSAGCKNEDKAPNGGFIGGNPASNTRSGVWGTTRNGQMVNNQGMGSGVAPAGGYNGAGYNTGNGTVVGNP